MNQKLLDKLQRRAQSRGYVLYYPIASNEQYKHTRLAIAYQEPLYVDGLLTFDSNLFLLTMSTHEPKLVESVINSLPKVIHA